METTCGGSSMKHIKTWSERCEEHPDHQTGMVSERMIQERMQEEIDELRRLYEVNQDLLKALNTILNISLIDNGHWTKTIEREAHEAIAKATGGEV